ncbi:unnamed protein product [Allacma fusca]|uniref:Cytochrome b561 domain-containing protein n=1 Tax=Allacma fusca TaxID=39272 RepID=A0A8J2ME37_9HEXA|nr:unnamed protein product [Allacma fusca]
MAIILMLVYLNLATDPSKATFTWNHTSNLHIITMLMFFIFLQGYVILIFRIFPEKPKLIVKLLHFSLHLAVSIGVLVAFLSIVSYKNVTVRKKDEAVHFLSLHSWLGLGAIIIYYGQLVGGFVTFLLPFTPLRIRALVLPGHRAVGTLIFMLGGAAGITGFMHKDAWKTKAFSSEHLTVQFSGVFLVLFFLGVMILVTEHRFRRRPRPEGDILLEDTSKDDD